MKNVKVNSNASLARANQVLIGAAILTNENTVAENKYDSIIDDFDLIVKLTPKRAFRTKIKINSLSKFMPKFSLEL